MEYKTCNGKLNINGVSMLAILMIEWFLAITHGRAYGCVGFCGGFFVVVFFTNKMCICPHFSCRPVLSFHKRIKSVKKICK